MKHAVGLSKNWVDAVGARELGPIKMGLSVLSI